MTPMNGSKPDNSGQEPAHYTPQDLARAMGVSTSTVKRWADQGLFPVRRTEGGHRRIPREDAQAFLRERGVSVAGPPGKGAEADGPPDLPEGSEAAVLFRLLSEGREMETLEHVLSQCRAGRSLAEILHHGLTPALRQIGVLWQAGHYGIFAEHVASRITARVLAAARPLQAPDGPLALGGALENDSHGLASAMAAGVIEATGWQVMDLGSFSPAPMLAEQAHARGASLVWVALGTTNTPDLLQARLEALSQALDTGGSRPVVVAGGPGYRGTPFLPPPGVQMIETLPQLAELASRLRQGA